MWCEAPDSRKYFRCSLCELVFIHHTQLPVREMELARYNEHNNDLSSLAYLSYLDRLAAPVVEKLAIGEIKGLDFGCGPVEGMRHLLEPRGYEISSYDPYFFPETKLINNDYDFVLCSEVVEHFFEPAKGLAEIDELVKSGGFIGISSRLYPKSSEEFRNWGYRRDPTHVVFFSELTVKWVAKKFGWELINLNSPIWIFRKR
jgi:SAM-dependent methyltransferase